MLFEILLYYTPLIFILIITSIFGVKKYNDTGLTKEDWVDVLWVLLGALVPIVNIVVCVIYILAIKEYKKNK